MKIALVSVLVDDPQKAHRFYTEVLGFNSRLFMPEANLAIVASPEAPDGTGLLLEPNENPIAKPFQQGAFEQGLPVIVFETADLETEYRRLQDRGVVFRKPPTPASFGQEALFEDTCGNLIQLIQMG